MLGKQVRYLKIAIGVLTMMTLIGSSSESSSQYKDQTTIGQYQVNWNKIIATDDKANQTPLFFSFSSRNKSSSLVTEENWRPQAQRFNITVEMAKTILGTDVNRTKEGGVDSCTQIAIRKGYCGKRTYPSSSQKMRYVQDWVFCYAVEKSAIHAGFSENAGSS